jgi:hypothetical protein
MRMRWRWIEAGDVREDGDPGATRAPARKSSASETWSQITLGVEVAFLLAPVTMLAAFWLIAFSISPGGGTAALDGLAAVVAVCCVFLAMAWWVVGRFLFQGRAGLARCGRWPLALVDLAALVTAACLVLAGLQHCNLIELAQWKDPVRLTLFGVPVLVPYIHLVIERRLGRSIR